jgi:hypothetical protein
VVPSDAIATSSKDENMMLPEGGDAVNAGRVRSR